MSDDEAFLRTIVTSPNHDTPRLVYADWLDDHGDPRAAFLRAEIAWAKPWAAGSSPALEPKLTETAQGLDPLWVARISRPPVGVCCDHLTVMEAAAPVAAATLTALEQQLRLTLPVELRAMLLNRNGGVPQPCGYRAPWLKPGDSPDFIAWFFSAPPVHPPKKPRNPQEELDRDQHDLQHSTIVLNNGFVSRRTDPEANQKWVNGVREMIALAQPAGGLGVIGIGLTARRSGKVYAINRTLLSTASPPRKIADSLPEFLSMVTIPWNH